MPIYTRTGDKGMTAVFGGKRVSKADAQIEATGVVDELTTYVGYVITKLPPVKQTDLTEIQKDLYKIMSFVAGASIPIAYLEERTKDFEQDIDKVTSKLSKLSSFILPGGTEEAALFHILRVLTRKAERATIVLQNQKTTFDLSLVIQYLNRLSDLFFTLARHYGKHKETVVKL